MFSSDVKSWHCAVNGLFTKRQNFTLVQIERICRRKYLTHNHIAPHFDTLKIYIAVENIVRKGEIACNKKFFVF